MFFGNDEIDNQSEDVNKKLLKDCIKRSGNESLGVAKAALYILEELCIQLRETQKLRVVKFFKLDIRLRKEQTIKNSKWRG